MLTYSDTYDSCRRTCQALPNAQYLQFPVWLVSAYFILPFFRLLSNNLKAAEIKYDHTYSFLLYHETPEFARCIFRSHTIIFQHIVIFYIKSRRQPCCSPSHFPYGIFICPVLIWTTNGQPGYNKLHRITLDKLVVMRCIVRFCVAFYGI